MSFNDHLSTFKARLANLNVRARSYSKIIPWIFRDFLKGGWHRCLLLLAMAGVAVGFRVSVVALILASIKKFASSGTGSASTGLIEVPYLGAVDYTLFGALIFLCLSINALVNFLYERAVFVTAGSYQPIVLKRSLALYAELPDLRRSLDLPSTILRNMLGAIGRHGRMITIFLRIILFSSLEFISAVACYIVLVFINPFITLVFTGIIIIFLPVFYYLSLYAIRQRQSMPQAFGEMTSALRVLEGSLQAHTPLAADERTRKIDELIDGPVAQRAFDAFQQQRFVIFKTQLVSGFLTAIILSLSVTLFFASFRHSEAFGDDFALFFSLLFVMGMSLARSLRALVSGNRFYDSLQFFYALLGPGGEKARIAQADKGSGLAYQRADGEILALDPKCTVYLFIANVQSRFSFQPVVNRILPLHEQSPDEQGSLVFLESAADIENFDPAAGHELVFVRDAVVGSGRTGKGRDRLDRIYGSGPRFIVIDRPLDSAPKTTGQWLYVWGTAERVVGDLSKADNLQLPNAERLHKRLAVERGKPRGQDMLDVEELEM